MKLLLVVTAFFTAVSANTIGRRDALTDCLARYDVPVVLTSSNDFAAQINPFNSRFSSVRTARVVVIPTTFKHVQASVKCAGQSNIKLTAKSGGHSYGAYGLAGHLVVNLESFQTISYNATTGIATVGAGVRLGNMAKKLYELGRRALPHGTCPGVGIGGHATLGGFGLDSRMWGLTTDAVESMRVVYANGNSGTVSATSNKELFWALRGAGAGLVVVTEFRLRTRPAPESNVVWSYSYTFPDPVKAAEAAIEIQSFGLNSAPKELGYELTLVSGGSLTLSGVYYGAATAVTPLLQPLLTKLHAIHGGNPDSTNRKTQGWLDSLKSLAGGEPLETPIKGYNEHSTFYAKSIVTKTTAPLSRSAFTGLMRYLSTTTAPASTDYFIIFNLYGGPNSAINAVPRSATAYPHRDSGFVAQFYGYQDGSGRLNSAALIGYIKGMVDSMGSEAAGLAAYAPYADPELTREEAQRRYWGSENLARLKAVKEQYDAKRTIWNPQGF